MSEVFPKGFINLTVEDIITGNIIANISKSNTVVNKGKEVLAKAMANQFSSYSFYINKMVFGTGGEDGTVPKTIDVNREDIYNPVLEISVNPEWVIGYKTRFKCTGIISTTECNGMRINEAGLRTAEEELFSMVTFSGLTKNNELKFTLNWTIVFA